MKTYALLVLTLLLLGALVHPLVSIATERKATAGASARTRPAHPVVPQQTAPATTRPAEAVLTASTPSAPVVTPPAPAELTLVRGQTGFWRLAKSSDGVWWFVSPDDRREFLNTVTTVQPYQRARNSDGPHYVSRDWNGSTTKDGDLQAWATATADRVRDAGFKGLGAWCHPAFHETGDLPFTRDLNIWAWMHGDTRRLYHPEWSKIAELAVSTQVARLRDNPRLVGYFSDNELDWGDEACGPGVYFDHLSNEDPNRVEVLKVIRDTWPSLDAFNADWKSALSDWAELALWKTIPHEQPKAYSKLYSAWLSHLAADYFRITSELIRKADPNHLVLGVRFKGYAPMEVVRASKDHTDAQSINYYVSDGRLDFDHFNQIHEQSGGQPVMLTEYSFHALDGSSGNRNTVGFSGQVLDQEARADGYHLFTTRLARVPYMVGADWFQWNDEPPSGRIDDGEDVNFGIVDVDDRAYDALVEAVRKTTPLLNGLHAGSATDDDEGVWRESYAQKPVMRVPYLPSTVRLNGELSDWPASAKLHRVRHSQTIGLERSKRPSPNVFVGWREEGLYLGFEVFDDDIQGVPASGWWWTRDNVEWWVSTRPVAPEQDYYDVNCQQYFFVPNDFSRDGKLGVAGQWHRPGDALKDHLIPHPTIKPVVRVRPDRYVVELLIPAEAMNGWDPKTQSQLAFNFHARNFQHATDYFWSAPKHVSTQLRPNTWGTLLLEPQGSPMLDKELAQTNMIDEAAPASVR